MGANIHAKTTTGLTPLHTAADGKNAAAVQLLLAAGADPNARNDSDLTPLEYALQRVSNAELVALVPVLEALKSASAQTGQEISAKCKEFMVRAAETFEFHRAGFNPDLAEEASVAMLTLCGLVGIEPPKTRKVHDGKAPIVVKSTRWQEQHAELWELLVPSSGACKTVQGEVVRIAGRISDELYRNGGGNWDRDYRAMVTAFCKWMATGKALSGELLAECAELARRLPAQEEATRRLTELATVWVGQNPTPIALPAPKYTR